MAGSGCPAPAPLRPAPPRWAPGSPAVWRGGRAGREGGSAAPASRFSRFPAPPPCRRPHPAAAPPPSSSSSSSSRCSAGRWPPQVKRGRGGGRRGQEVFWAGGHRVVSPPSWKKFTAVYPLFRGSSGVGVSNLEAFNSFFFLN